MAAQNNMLNKTEHVFIWNFGGEDVRICGEFNQWQGEKMEVYIPGQRVKTQFLDDRQLAIKLGQQQPTHYFVTFLDPRRYEYKFKVDAKWRCAHDQQITRDQGGNENNVVDL